MENYTVVNIDEVDGAFGGALKRVRAATGTTAFGMQVVDLPPDSGDLYPAHSHDEQEEVFTTLRGGGDIVVGEETVSLEPGRIIRVGPNVNRQLRSGPEGMRVLIVGGTPGAAYEPPEWTNADGGEPSPSSV